MMPLHSFATNHQFSAPYNDNLIHAPMARMPYARKNILSMQPGGDLIRILIIEDNYADVLLVKWMLRSVSRHETYVITDTPRMAEALELLDRESFDVVLLDLHLLDIDGVAAVSALHTEMPNTPIIVYSSAHDPRLREAALMCGAKQYIVKGGDNAVLLRDLIQEALSCVTA